MNNYIVSLTTIPSKFDDLYITIDSLVCQTVIPCKIVINIPRKYNFRMNNSEIPSDKLNDFIDKYSKYNVCINFLDKDYGPGTKLLGLLNSSIINNYDISNTYIILVDDDVVYKHYMIEHFEKCIISNNAEVASFFVYDYYNLKIGQGVDGFLIKLSALNHFLLYYNLIKDFDYIHYHDDFYISYFFHLINKNIEYIQLDQCLIYYIHSTTFVDCLNNIDGKYSRHNSQENIFNIVNDLNKNGDFDHLKKLNLYDSIDYHLSRIEDYKEKSNDEIFEILAKNEQLCEILNGLNKRDFFDYLKQLDM